VLSTDNLKAEVMDLITELFCEGRKLSADITFQVKERTSSMLLSSVEPIAAQQTFAFDHEEFKNFFLGEALGRICSKANPSQKMELLALLRKGTLPGQAVDAAVSVIRKTKPPCCEKTAAFLQEVASLDGPTSLYT